MCAPAARHLGPVLVYQLADFLDDFLDVFTHGWPPMGFIPIISYRLRSEQNRAAALDTSRRAGSADIRSRPTNMPLIASGKIAGSFSQKKLIGKSSQQPCLRPAYGYLKVRARSIAKHAGSEIDRNEEEGRRASIGFEGAAYKQTATEN
jgi:hypothetical protein